jgi:hypothetical protein
MVLSLAGLRFRRAFEEDRGPVAKLETGEINVGGRPWHQVNAFLTDSIRPNRNHELYSQADGTGADPTWIIASHKAISEAMERWAYYQTAASPDAFLYGFDVDPTTNGMAAYPGLFARQARKAARLEGVERAAVFAWWDGLLDGRVVETDWPETHAVILSPPGGAFVAIVFTRTQFGTYAFGNGASETISEAILKGYVEMGRHDRAVRRYLGQPIGTPPPANLLERRALFFSSKEGFETFSDRLQRPAAKSVHRFEPICDREIPGPWSQFATVWRVAFRPPSDAFLSPNENYFYW